ncbi:MAG: hypothetical protein JSV53_09125 [candidate division WOR-3 bacterium]|nr:MAG: hypothetical protein JSV53_09125 [candidate division WOR-3 bacterium]
MIAITLLFLCGWFNWKTLKTDDFTVIYKDGYYWEALHTLQNLHYYQNNVQSLIGDSLRDLPVVVEDVGAVSNGFANPIFHNVHIFTRTQGFEYRLEGIESWYRTVAVHEYAHILHLSRANGFAGLLTSVFGSLFAPNLYSPGWITEGVTVYSESQFTQYEGRLNDGFFDSYIGAQVHAGVMPSIVEATNTPLDFPFGTYYLYGGEFFNFLALNYGADKLSGFFDRYGSYFWAPLSGIFPFTGLDIAARKSFGKSWPQLFAEWRRYERQRFLHWEPAGVPITQQGWYVYSLVEKDSLLYYVRYTPVKVDGFYQKDLIHLVEFNCRTAVEKVIKTLNSTITTPLRVYDDKLYYTTRQFINGYPNVYYLGHGVVANLHEYDLITGEDRILFTDDIRSFCVLRGGRILYSRDRIHDFGSEMRVYDGYENTLLFETDMLIGELDATRAYTAVVARHDFENWNIYLLDFEAGKFVPVVTTPWVEGSIALNGDSLFFTANYDKIYGIYMCDLMTGALYRLTGGGYADHGVVVGNDLYFLGMSEQGFDIYTSEFNPVRYERVEEEPSPKPNWDDNALVIKDGGYGDVMKTLIPSFRLPFVFPTKDDFSEWAYGLLFLGGDATDENIYGGFIAQDPREQNLFFNFLWQSRFFSPLDIFMFYDYQNEVEYTIAYPAYLNLEYGISNLTLFIDGRIFDGADRIEFVPGFSAAVQYPYTTFSVRMSFPFERQSWGSDINRSGQRLQLGVRQFMLGGEFRFYSDAYVDRRNPDVRAFSLRGYDEIESSRALVMAMEYGHRLLKLRGGLWNPNIYFEDLFWSAFADFALTDAGTTYYSVGMELRLETKTGFGFVQVIPRFGIALTKAGEVKTFFTLSPKLPF